MRQLVVIRHAIAHERDSQQWPDDDKRPLTDAGKRRFRKAACGLATWVRPPDEMLTSTLTRARQTARILERKASFPKAVTLRELRPDVDAHTLIAALRKRRNKRIAIVGHEPALSELVRRLLGRGVLNAPLKKGGVVLIGFEGRIEAGKGMLLAFAPPRALVAARRG